MTRFSKKSKMASLSSSSSSFFFWWVLLLLVGFRVQVSLCHSSSSSSFLKQPKQAPRQTAEHDNHSRNYKLWRPVEIRDELQEWSTVYSDFAKVSTSQEMFALPRAGSTEDCPFDDMVEGCNNYVLEIQDYLVHPPNSPSAQLLPEVLWSGAVHGNERVGPTAVMEASWLLLQAADCEAKPRLDKKKKQPPPHNNDDNNNDDAWTLEIEQAHKCRQELQSKGIGDIERQWLARLVTTRRIIVVPTANALGYYRNQRTEGSIDPNRDFPFDIQDPRMCMQTIAGRTLNELFRKHVFQLSLTFHGGLEVIGYEWGAPTYLNHLSPDHVAQDQIARSYSDYGGSFATSPQYSYGTMNDLVYYVRGGMEDWAYAGSWDTDRVLPCEPTTFGGYPTAKTIYDDSMLRTFNMLVETSNQKEPRESTLGNSQNVLNRHTPGNGHVSRNIRLALLAAEMVEPYVSIVAVEELVLSDDIIPWQSRDRDTCQSSSTHTVMVAAHNTKVKIQWTVGGAFTIDETSLFVGNWNDVESLDCHVGLQSEVKSWTGLKNQLQQVKATSASRGSTYYSPAGAIPDPQQTTLAKHTKGPVFETFVDTSGYAKGDELIVIAMAKVDQNWKTQPTNIKPNLPPISHVVNARTNTAWQHQNTESGHRVTGRLEWISLPLTLVIGDHEMEEGGTQADGRLMVKAHELSNRFGQTTGYDMLGISPSGSTSSSSSSSSSAQVPLLAYHRYMGIMAALALAVTITIGFHKYRAKVTHQRLVNELYDEEHEFTNSQTNGHTVDHNYDSTSNFMYS